MMIDMSGIILNDSNVANNLGRITYLAKFNSGLLQVIFFLNDNESDSKTLSVATRMSN